MGLLGELRIPSTDTLNVPLHLLLTHLHILNILEALGSQHDKFYGDCSILCFLSDEITVDRTDPFAPSLESVKRFSARFPTGEEWTNELFFESFDTIVYTDGSKMH